MIFKQPVSSEIFFRKYALHGEKSLEEVLEGVAEEIASVEPTEELRKIWKGFFYQAMISGEFIPAGRILANARPNSPMKNYNNCFTIDLKDSMKGIFVPLQEDALIGQVGGGVGFNISKLRPKGSKISRGGESSGVMSFLEIFDTSAKSISTGGGRRAAHISILNIDHPDIEEFIEYKKGRENNKLTQFNISVGITDEFMRAVENNEDWNLVFPLMKFENESETSVQWKLNTFDLDYCKEQGYRVKDFNGISHILMKVYKTIKARDLYEKMTKQAWWYNEPGALFLDTVENENNAPHRFKLDRVNPCGEIVMPSYSLCCLSSINLSKLVKNQFTENAEFNWDEFKSIIKLGVRFLDNVLDATEYPLEKIEEISKAWRRIGLGITGLGDALMKMSVRYGSKESIEFTSLIGYHLANEAYKASTELAIEKGKFPAFDDKIGDYGFIKKLDKDVRVKIREYGLRNIALLTTAPTGTISLSLGNNCSSGIEPIFALQYDRTIRQENDSLKTETVYDDGWLEYLDFAKQNNFTIDPNGLPESIITSHDVSIKEGIDVQAALQYWIDHSISKTINMPFETTLDEYKDTFMYAWKQGLKGVTSFHEGAAMDGILSTKKEDKKDNFWKQIEVLPNSKKRPESLPCDIYEMQVNKQRVVVLVGKDDENKEPYEVFLTVDSDSLINLGNAKEGEIRKNGRGKYDLIIKGKRNTIILEDITSVFDDDYATMCRLLSLAMRHHIPLQFIVDQLNKTKRFDTFSKTMARVLKKYIVDGEKVISHEVCPECGGELHYQEGCKSCNCGWSKCG